MCIAAVPGAEAIWSCQDAVLIGRTKMLIFNWPNVGHYFAMNVYKGDIRTELFMKVIYAQSYSCIDI